MCGIIALVRGPGARRLLPASDIVDRLDRIQRAVDGAADPIAAAVEVATLLADLDSVLRDLDGVALLVRDQDTAIRVGAVCARVSEWSLTVEAHLDAPGAVAPDDLEAANAAVLALKDGVWAVARDRLPTADAVRDLVGAGASWSAIEVGTSIQQALSALDRLEVRGRDSAGLTVLVRDHGLDLADPAIARLVDARAADPLFRSLAVRTPEGHLSFVYKAAAEIGELGDNTRAIRSAIVGDDLLRLALAGDTASAMVLGHTRWASVGIISQPNAHPLDSTELERPDGPYVTAVLNGDVDNFADLRTADGLRLAAEITTDAKVIPTLVSRRLAEGKDLVDAFRDTVASFEGSVAIGASSASHPDQLLLALRGSGQGVYVGLADGCYIVASEPYGVVELTDTYLRLDGETPANPDNPTASRGQILVLDGSRAGTLEGILRQGYDGTPLPVSPDDLSRAEITTRDIDRGAYPHFLLKEITEAPASFRKTLRGKLVDGPDGPTVLLGPDVLPESIRAAPARRQHPPGAGDRPGHRPRGRHQPRRRPRRGPARRSPPHRLAPRHGAVRVRPPQRHVRHARGGDQPVGHHHRHQPDGRPRAGQGRPRHRHRQPATVRPHRPGRRGAATRRTGATSR